VTLASTHPLPRTLAAPRLNLRLAVGVLVLGGAMLGLVVVYRGAQPRTVDVLRAAHDVGPARSSSRRTCRRLLRRYPTKSPAAWSPRVNARAWLVGASASHCMLATW
jgi:hypothetical protein